jgi:hypothetical protein
MLAMERKPSLSVTARRGAELRVERTDVAFCDSDGDQVRIQITVHNAGDLYSRPTIMKVESAPFGAFVSWRPLTQLTVPALGPGESLELSTEVPRHAPSPSALSTAFHLEECSRLWIHRTNPYSPTLASRRFSNGCGKRDPHRLREVVQSQTRPSHRTCGICWDGASRIGRET